MTYSFLRKKTYKNMFADKTGCSRNKVTIWHHTNIQADANFHCEILKSKKGTKADKKRPKQHEKRILFTFTSTLLCPSGVGSHSKSCEFTAR